jgi:hypothetical protein
MKVNFVPSFLILSSIALVLLGIWLFLKSKPAYHLPKVIWQFWDKEELPPMIQMIKENNAKKLHGWKIQLLNENTMGDYVSSSDIPPGYNNLGAAHKADWLRLYLLKKYGGVWMDASIIINDPTAIDKLYTESVEKQSELTLFQFKSHLNVENWFIMAPEKSRMTEAWFKEYDSAIRMEFENYKRKLWNEGVNTSCGRDEDSIKDTYFTQHSGIQRILQKEIVPNPNIIVNKAEETMLKVDFICDIKDEKERMACLTKNYSDFEIIRLLPYIKINGPNRKLPINWKKYFETT